MGSPGPKQNEIDTEKSRLNLERIAKLVMATLVASALIIIITAAVVVGFGISGSDLRKSPGILAIIPLIVFVAIAGVMSIAYRDDGFFGTLSSWLIRLLERATRAFTVATGFSLSRQVETSTPLFIHQSSEQSCAIDDNDIERAIHRALGIQQGTDDDLRTSVIAAAGDRLSESVIDDLRLSVTAAMIRDTLSESQDRLKGAIDQLKARIAQNLGIGTILAFVGILILAYFIGDATLENDLTLFVQHSVPRMFLVILVEGLSLFFLKLYRAGLNDIKFYESELTGVEARGRAIFLALDSGDLATIRTVAGCLSALDRNVIPPKKSRSSGVTFDRSDLMSLLTLIRDTN